MLLTVIDSLVRLGAVAAVQDASHNAFESLNYFSGKLLEPKGSPLSGENCIGMFSALKVSQNVLSIQNAIAVTNWKKYITVL